jgi:hypothetical protein
MNSTASPLAQCDFSLLRLGAGFGCFLWLTVFVQRQIHIGPKGVFRCYRKQCFIQATTAATIMTPMLIVNVKTNC